MSAAVLLPVRELRAALTYWCEAVDRRAAMEEGDRRRDARRLHVSPALDGMVRVDGDLDPERRQIVLTALRAVGVATRSTSERRTAPQRRADALGEICHQWMDGANRGSIAGERPHLTVTVDLATLEGRSGRRCELDDAGTSHPRTGRGSRATPRSTVSSSPARLRRSRSAAERSSCRRRSVAPSSFATAAVGSGAATGHRDGATATTSSTGRMAAPLRSTTSCCCAGRPPDRPTDASG